MGKLEELKRVIIDFVNSEYNNSLNYEEFETYFQDFKHMGLAYTETEDSKHEIQFEIDIEELTWSLLIDDIVIQKESYCKGLTEDEALDFMINEFKTVSFEDLIRVDVDIDQALQQNKTVKMNFQEMKQTILSLQREDYREFIKAIISIEKDIDDEEFLDALYDYYIDVSDMCLINDDFDNAIYVYEDDDSEEPLCHKMLQRGY